MTRISEQRDVQDALVNYLMKGRCEWHNTDFGHGYTDRVIRVRVIRAESVSCKAEIGVYLMKRVGVRR